MVGMIGPLLTPFETCIRILAKELHAFLSDRAYLTHGHVHTRRNYTMFTYSVGTEYLPVGAFIIHNRESRGRRIRYRAVTQKLTPGSDDSKSLSQQIERRRKLVTRWVLNGLSRGAVNVHW